MKEYGLIGRGISHSFSGEYFNKKFAQNNIDAVYNLFDLKDITLLSELKLRPNLQGLNVTSPYKRDVIPLLDFLSDEARELNAVNVIEFIRDSSGKLTLKGHNTDFEGFGKSIDGMLPEGSKSLIMGTGGASSAVALALKKRGIPYKFVSRHPSDEIISYKEMNQTLQDYNLIINATPLGMFPQVLSCPDIDFNKISSGHFCYDLIYNPEETVFLAKAKSRGARVMNGMNMLLNQAELGWAIWTKNER